MVGMKYPESRCSTIQVPKDTGDTHSFWFHVPQLEATISSIKSFAISLGLDASRRNLKAETTRISFDN